MHKMKDLEQASYVLLPAKLPFNEKSPQVHNRVFDFWVQQWTKTFAETGSPESYWPDHFQRQDVIAALITPSEVLGCHLYTFYNFDSHATLKSEYFHYLPDLAIQKTKKLGLKNFMTMEYLCANPDWKLNEQHLSISALIIALGMRVANSFGADASLGMPIHGTSVGKNTQAIGWTTLHGPISKYGYKLDYIYHKTNSHGTMPNSNFEKWTQHFWDQKIASIELPTQQTITKAA